MPADVLLRIALALLSFLLDVIRIREGKNKERSERSDPKQCDG